MLITGFLFGSGFMAGVCLVGLLVGYIVENYYED